MRLDRTGPRVLQTSTPLPQPRPPPQLHTPGSSGPRKISASRALQNPRPGFECRVPRLPEPLGRRAASPASRAICGTVTSLGEAGAFTASLLAPSREAGGEAGARAWWLRGLWGGLLPQTSGYRCLQRRTHRGSLGSDCPQFNTHLLRLRSRSLKTSKSSGARRAPKEAKQAASGSTSNNIISVPCFSLVPTGRENWETRGSLGMVDVLSERSFQG